MRPPFGPDGPRDPVRGNRPGALLEPATDEVRMAQAGLAIRTGATVGPEASFGEAMANGRVLIGSIQEEVMVKAGVRAVGIRGQRSR